ncbi:hypothetical protein [Dokdonia sp. Hel_I_53]|uniref:hypothetical protein n=1 Tax=Dokdonia sp. Hel_I_53 TaxID=1566287 RepID=UPI0011A45BEC|nr:hypothetical protein [Dokdonia sp. Hel_I_53]
MNNNTLPMTPEELKAIEKEYEKGNSKLKKTSIIAPGLGIAALFAPPELWNFIKFFDKKRTIRNLEDVAEPMYKSPTMIIIVVIGVALTIFLTYYAFVRSVKRDLEDKEKIREEFNVIGVKNLSKKVAENLEGLDTVLHFEKNNSKIKKHLFKKSKNPELLNAKSILIERSKHAGIIFLEEIIK